MHNALAALLCALWPAQLFAQASTDRPGSPRATSLAPTMTGWFDLRPADPALYVIAAGLWVGSGAAGAVLLSRRGGLRAQSAALVNASTRSAAARIELERPALNADYNAKGTALVVVAASVNSLVVASSVLGLPEQSSVPWWAWAAGGAGAALLVSGAVATLSVDRCELASPEQTCDGWTRDSLFGPWLMIHAAAPLSVGLTYALSQLGRDDVSVALSAEPRRAEISLRGSF